MSEKSITVAQMLPELDGGGVERGTLEMGAYLVKNGHRSIVVSGGGRMVPQLEREGSRHVSLPVGEKNFRALPAIFQVRKLLLAERVDILHLRSRMPAWVGYLAVRTLPVSRRPHVVTTFHGFYSVNKYSAIMTRGERIIAISTAVSDHIKTRYPVDPCRIQIIHRGVNEADFTPDAVSPERIAGTRALWGIPDASEPVILLPARITRLKGHDLFIQSLAPLRDLPWRAVCVGDVENKTGYQTSLIAMAQQYGIGDRVRFPGHCPDMPAAYMASDIVVSASSSEPEAFGRTVIEANAMGKPVVATAHGGSLETVLDGQTGWLVPAGNPDAMSTALREALTMPEKRERFGKKGRSRVLEEFTTRKMCEKTVHLYADLLAEHLPHNHGT